LIEQIKSLKEGFSMKGSLMKRDPFKAIGRWDPLSELREMQYGMDRLFSRLLGREISVPDVGFGEWTPSVESYVKDNTLIFKCELPGVDPKDVDVSFDDSTHQLVIKGERKAEKETKDEDYLHREFDYGTFVRRFTLPEGVKTDQLKATYSNGILQITVPAPAISKAKKIEIESKPAEGEKAAKKAA
jgi:HSP20 family protein